ncbi:unnamed protein product [Porites evermanni]|uniref:Ribosomal protein S12 n=1 Tax=Porites evermanni TaxID=104178 RepID=A0ABN8LF55_9CNID|nr:unnamed protein product [Porites evermanni]
MFQLLENKHYQPFIVPSGSYRLTRSLVHPSLFFYARQPSCIFKFTILLTSLTHSTLQISSLLTKLRPEVHHQIGGVKVEDGRRGLIHRKELGFRILIVSGISDPLSCIPDSKAHNDERCRRFKEHR